MRREQGGKKGGRRGWEGAELLGVGGNSGGCEASEVDPDPHRVEWEEGGRKASRVEENPGRGCQGVGGGVELSLDDSICHGEGRGVELSQDYSTLNRGGGGVESWQDDSTPKENRRGVVSSWDDSTPREDGGLRGDETLGAPTAS